MVRLDRERPVATGDRLAVLLELCEAKRQVGQGFDRIGVCTERRSYQLHALIIVPLSKSNGAQDMERVELARVSSENLAAQILRLGKSTLLNASGDVLQRLRKSRGLLFLGS